MSVKVSGLTKTYGPQKAIDDLNFRVESGEVVGFLGPNGAGKTTTMKIITCFMAPSQGDVEVNGISIHDDALSIKQKIGYLPEHNPLYEDMYVIDYLDFVARLQGVGKEKMQKRIREMIGYCGLDKEKHKKIGELSKGYRQRVGLAQAIIHDPEVIILDEPTTGLDPNQIVEIRHLIKNLSLDKTIILSTHIMQEVEQTCDRILIINNGSIVADGTAENLSAQLQGSEILTVRIEAPDETAVLQALEKLPQVEEAKKLDRPEFYEIKSIAEGSSRKEVFKTCADKGWYLLEMTGVETRLEDVFRKLTN